jgi:hypothetical protein
LYFGSFGRPVNNSGCSRQTYLHGFEEGLPRLVQLNQHLIADLARERLVGGVAFDQVINRRVVQVAPLRDEGLAHEVVGGVPEVLGGKGGRIDRAIALILARDDVLFNQSHAQLLLGLNTAVALAFGMLSPLFLFLALPSRNGKPTPCQR